jgi:thiol-disulfide isomerase/thioredoxin
MKKCFLIVMFMVSGFVMSKAQSSAGTDAIKTGSSSVRKLLVGDQMPDIVIPNLINYPKAAIRLSDLRGKLVILDFWHTRCSSCVSKFPKLKELQDKYPTQLSVILVTYESRQLIEEFLIRLKKVTGQTVKLPIACQTDLLTHFIPLGFPHYIWIDQKGFVRFITHSSVTDENIEAFLNGEPVEMKNEVEDTSHFNTLKPMFIRGNGGDGTELACYSMLSKSIKSAESYGEYYGPGTKNSTFYAINQPVKAIFQIAFNDFRNGWYIPDNRTIMQVRDTAKYGWFKDGKLRDDNRYAYQLSVPYSSAEALKKMMQDDLMRYFKLEAHMEKRTQKCWVMRAEDTCLLISKGGEYVNDMSDQDFSINIRNVPDSTVGQRFIYNIFYSSPYPFINEIHMKSNIDIIMDEINFDDAEAVIRAVKQKYKLDIRLEEHAVDMLVISEPGYNSATFKN